VEAELKIGAVMGGYRIEGVAGRGGMGVVYRATQIALDRTVALKLLAPELAEDDAFRERFQRESRLLAATDHPNVITIHEAGEDDGHLFIAMRYVQGTDLRALLKSGGPLEPGRAAALVAQVASALDAAHARGLIHRDVKPANVLIEERDGAEHAYLTDFGLTKTIGSTAGGLTATGQFVGTVDFIAPEQVMGQHVDARADVYALGCVLFTALTGRVPFERDSEVSKIFAHVNDPPPSLLEGLPEAPIELDAVVRRALEKDPAARFPSAGDLGRATVAAVEGRPRGTSERIVAAGEAALGPKAAPQATADTRQPAYAMQPGAASAGPARTVGGKRWRVAATLALAAAVVVAAAVALLSGGGSSQDDDGALNAVLRPQPIPVHGAPAHVAVGGGAAWVASTDAGEVTPIDANGKKGKPISVGDAPAALAAGDGVVLMIVQNGAGVAWIDMTKRRLAGTAPVELRGDSDLVFGDHAFWGVVSDNEVGRIDAETGRVVATVPTPDGLTGRLAFGQDAVWATADSKDRPAVFRIDPASHKLTATVPLGRNSYPEGLAFGEGGLWIVDTNRDALLRVDPATNRVTRRVQTEDGFSTDDIAIMAGAIWQANNSPATLRRFDPANGALVQKTPIQTYEPSELAVGIGSAWLTAPDTDVVTRFGY
jgi:serine/threonine-protein kinase